MSLDLRLRRVTMTNCALITIESTPIESAAREWVAGRAGRGELVGRSPAVEMARLRSLAAVHPGPLACLDRDALLRWQRSIGRRAPATRRSYLSTVQHFCRWLVAEGYLGEDPSIGLVRVREPRRVPRALAARDVALVLTACSETRTKAIVWLMVGCGLRCCEVSNLDLADYDPRALIVGVRGKAGNERTLPVPVVVAEAVDAYVRSRGRVAGALFVPQPRGWRATDRVSAHRISDLVGEVMVAAGVHHPGDGRSAHALRHTAASDVLDTCRDLRIVQQMLGHQSLATTQIYLRRADLGSLREAMEGREYRAA